MPSLADQVKFASGAVRGADVAGSTTMFPARYDLISPIGLRRIAETYGEGSLKYGDRNWEKGIPQSVMANHALAHIFAYLSGDRTEDHIGHAAWNLIGLMHNEEKFVGNKQILDLVRPTNENDAALNQKNRSDLDVGPECTRPNVLPSREDYALRDEIPGYGHGI